MAAAVNLKNDMTKERAVYRCFWVDIGQEFDKAYIDPPDDVDDDGDLRVRRVLLCTFPGIFSVLKENNELTMRKMVNAHAMFESY